MVASNAKTTFCGVPIRVSCGILRLGEHLEGSGCLFVQALTVGRALKRYTIVDLL